MRGVLNVPEADLAKQSTRIAKCKEQSRVMGLAHTMAPGVGRHLRHARNRALADPHPSRHLAAGVRREERLRGGGAVALRARRDGLGASPLVG